MQIPPPQRPPSAILRRGLVAAVVLALLLLDSNGGAGEGSVISLSAGGGALPRAHRSIDGGGSGGVRFARVRSVASSLSPPGPQRAVEEATIYEPLAGSGDFGGTPHMRVTEAFVGLPSLHMSSHRCVGAHPLSGSCAFRNLYVSSVPGIGVAELSPHHSGDWTYATSVPATEVAAGRWPSAVLRDLVWALEEELRVSLHSRLPITESKRWSITIAVFAASPARNPTASVASNGGVVSAEVPLTRPWPLSRQLGDLVVDAESMRGCLLHPHLPHGVACIPPGVAGIVPQPFFLMHRTHGGNIGHSLWDDCLAFLQAMEDLGLSPRLGDYDLLLTEEAGGDRRWGSTGASLNVRELFTLTSPGRKPVEVADLDDALARLGSGAVVLVPEVAGGITGMSPHNLRPDMRAYGSERRSVWRLRNHLLAAAGISEGESLRPAADIPMSSPQLMRLLYVRGKRPVWNEPEMLSALRSEFPELVVDVLAWEKLGRGLRGEAEELLRTHIFLAMDGTVALNALFLPPGAVHIQLGVARPWGSQVQCDFLFSSLDHVRVLFYGELAQGEHAGEASKGFSVPPAKLSPLVRDAIALVREQFPVPTAPDANLAPSARLLAMLLTKHEDFADLLYSGRITWEDLKRAPYAEVAPRLYSQKAAKSDADRERFEADVRDFCAAHPCSP